LTGCARLDFGDVVADFERREPYPQKVEKAPNRNGSGQGDREMPGSNAGLFADPPKVEIRPVLGLFLSSRSSMVSVSRSQNPGLLSPVAAVSEIEYKHGALAIMRTRP
jgi:hypothetical protein